MNESDYNHIPIDKVAENIVDLTMSMTNFWRSPIGWAPVEAAQLLSKSRLDWQLSIAKCLQSSVINSASYQSPGNLIINWTILGCLVEGTLKLFLSVYYKDYSKDVDAIRKRGDLVDPDILCLEALRQFYEKRIWVSGEKWDSWIRHIQYRRNAIHAFADRDIGSSDEFLDDVRTYLTFIEEIDSRLPYPDNCL